MASGDVELKVGADVVRPIIEAKIQAAVIAALSDSPSVLDAVVGKALGRQVNAHNGNAPQYSSDKTVTLLEYLAGVAIKESCESAVKQWVVEQKDTIRASMERQLRKSVTGLAGALVGGLEKAFEETWRLRIDCSFEDRNR